MKCPECGKRPSPSNWLPTRCETCLAATARRVEAEARVMYGLAMVNLFVEGSKA